MDTTVLAFHLQAVTGIWTQMMIASHVVGFEPVIGLEIHARLLTNTKIFCGCSTRFGHAPNTNVCPVCLGFPGALPVLNRRAVDFATKAALALNCTVQERSIFARKNYFYPDLPKGYQISQYELPLATAGALEFGAGGAARRVRITRVHMEEDAGKSLHEGFADSDRSTYLDFNRSGTPLIEIVTEPDLRSAADAANAFRRLREILIAIGVNDGNMEEGSLRCDANVSVRPQGAQKLGIKTEVKNINSFRFLEKALDYEIARQVNILEHGGTIVQETRLWDAAVRETFSMRTKEDAHDYRYFPEPDLPPVQLTRERIEEIRGSIIELPEARRQRVMAQYSLSEAEVISLENTELTALFEETAKASGNPRAAFNWVSGEVARKLNDLGERFDRQRVTPRALAGLIGLVDNSTISASIGKTVFEKMYETGRSADEIVAADGLAQIGDEAAILSSVRAVIGANQDAVAQIRNGKTGTFGFLVGQVMKATGGKANPRLVNELLRREIDK
jgi:aspartyl-tRNA(Asn)/glutamyl-tRNA(Gln) amidotransferase subunit B